MQKPDEVLLKHRLDAAEQALGLARNCSRTDLDTEAVAGLNIVKFAVK